MKCTIGRCDGEPPGRSLCKSHTAPTVGGSQAACQSWGVGRGRGYAGTPRAGGGHPSAPSKYDSWKNCQSAEESVRRGCRIHGPRGSFVNQLHANTRAHEICRLNPSWWHDGSLKFRHLIVASAMRMQHYPCRRIPTSRRSLPRLAAVALADQVCQMRKMSKVFLTLLHCSPPGETR